METGQGNLQKFSPPLYGLLGSVLITASLGSFLLLSISTGETVSNIIFSLNLRSSSPYVVTDMALGILITIWFLVALTVSSVVPYYVINKYKNFQSGVKIFLYQLLFTFIINGLLISYAAIVDHIIL